MPKYIKKVPNLRRGGFTYFYGTTASRGPVKIRTFGRTVRGTSGFIGQKVSVIGAGATKQVTFERTYITSRGRPHTSVRTFSGISRPSILRFRNVSNAIAVRARAQGNWASV
jgi:hypothetical protein